MPSINIQYRPNLFVKYVGINPVQFFNYSGIFDILVSLTCTQTVL